jgi:hypothetical protein
MPLQRCRAAIMFLAFIFSLLLWLTFCTPRTLPRTNGVCPRAAHKSVTYRSLRSPFWQRSAVGRQNHTRIKSTLELELRAAPSIPVCGWPRLLLATTIKHGARKRALGGA